MAVAGRTENDALPPNFSSRVGFRQNRACPAMHGNVRPADQKWSRSRKHLKTQLAPVIHRCWWAPPSGWFGCGNW